MLALPRAWRQRPSPPLGRDRLGCIGGLAWQLFPRPLQLRLMHAEAVGRSLDLIVSAGAGALLFASPRWSLPRGRYGAFGPDWRHVSGPFNAFPRDGAQCHPGGGRPRRRPPFGNRGTRQKHKHKNENKLKPPDHRAGHLDRPDPRFSGVECCGAGRGGHRGGDPSERHVGFARVARRRDARRRALTTVLMK